MFDYHVHTEFSVDCKTPMRDNCAAALAAGITEIALTDHIDLRPSDPGYGYYRAEAYFESLASVRRTFAGEPLTILAGAEVDYHADTEPAVREFVERYGREYDFVIGSVHYASDGELIYPSTFARSTPDQVFADHFRQLIRSIETGWFDTIGHMDIPKRYLPTKQREYDPARYREQLFPVFDALIAGGVAFEINTSGVRQAPKASMPGPAIVRWYVEAGGTRITTGTDSHTAKTVGASVRETLEMLRLCGMESVLSFRGREGTPVPIDDLLSVAPGHGS
ncbi:MAG: histidinol-phosphatase HisJ family protein [Thermomicrobiales bacterium]|nr:histidinol-phosphatase HisJ family protein [Thermomicrobiales bacterium]